MRGAGRVRAGIVHSRTSEGRERAKAKGLTMGRKPKLTHHQQREPLQGARKAKR